MSKIPQTHQIYDEAIKMYALKYLSRYQDLDLVQYFEIYCGGPIVRQLVSEIGPRSVLLKLEAAITELL